MVCAVYRVSMALFVDFEKEWTQKTTLCRPCPICGSQKLMLHLSMFLSLSFLHDLKYCWACFRFKI
jgi:hypothetical protein